MSIGSDSFAETTATSATTRLRGWRLLAMRAFVIATMMVAVSLFALALPGLYSRLAVPCADALNQCLLHPQQVAPLAMLGLTPSSLALIAIGISYVAILLVILI